MINSPPNCRPECVSSSECDLSKACQNSKCVDPCVNGPCAKEYSRCTVINHSPICSCLHRGDPFSRCYPPCEIFALNSLSFFDLTPYHSLYPSSTSPWAIVRRAPSKPLYSISLWFKLNLSRESKRSGDLLLRRKYDWFTSLMPASMHSELWLWPEWSLHQSEMPKSLH